MPKMDKAQSSHGHSVSTASAARGGTRCSSWSTKDDTILIQARAQGLNWNQISPKHFPTKTANACRKRHERLMERQNAEQWDGGVKLDVLSQAYMEVRREMWGILAARVNEKWQLVEQKCMEKGIKNMTQAARSAQRKQKDGTYHEEDSGISISDLEEESSPADMLPSMAADAHSFGFQFPVQQQRVPSIQSMIHPTHQQHASQYLPQQHHLPQHTHMHQHPHYQQ